MKDKSIHNVVNISINCEKPKEITSSDYNQRDNTTRVSEDPEPMSSSENVVDELSEDLNDVCMVPTPRIYKPEIDEPSGITSSEFVPGVLAIAGLIGVIMIGYNVLTMSNL